VLGPYEDAVNAVVHGFPAPVGLYVFLPLVLLWTARRTWQLLRANDAQARAQGALLALVLFNLLYVVGISSAVTFLEESRYRYQAESFIWLTTALAATALVRWWQTRHQASTR
jgi:hypothetical protein